MKKDSSNTPKPTEAEFRRRWDALTDEGRERVARTILANEANAGTARG
jgi:hypothetical protein